MAIGDLRISKWVLSLEMACCFVPLTLFWLIVLFDSSGGTSLKPEILRQYFEAPNGLIVLAYILSMAVLGVSGPIGLFVAFRQIALGRSLLDRPIGIALMVGPALLGVAYVGTTLALGGPGRLIPWLGGVLLFAILPIIGTAHLRYLGWRNSARALAA